MSVVEQKDEPTVEEIHTVCRLLLGARDAVDAVNDELSKAKAYEKELEERLIRLLEASELSRIDSSGMTFSVAQLESVKVPKGDYNRALFFAYLREQGVFDEMISVNSKTLNSWFKAEREAAVQRGMIDFSIPGLDEVTPYKQLYVRKRAK